MFFDESLLEKCLLTCLQMLSETCRNLCCIIDHVLVPGIQKSKAFQFHKSLSWYWNSSNICSQRSLIFYWFNSTLIKGHQKTLLDRENSRQTVFKCQAFWCEKNVLKEKLLRKFLPLCHVSNESVFLEQWRHKNELFRWICNFVQSTFELDSRWSLIREF